MNRVFSQLSALLTASLFATTLTDNSYAQEKQAVLTLPLSKKPVIQSDKINLNDYADAVILGGNFVFYANGMTPCPNSPHIYIKRDAERLYLVYDNPMTAGERPKMNAAIPDHSGICADNVMELYIMPERNPGELLSFIQFAGKPAKLILGNALDGKNDLFLNDPPHKSPVGGSLFDNIIIGENNDGGI